MQTIYCPGHLFLSTHSRIILYKYASQIQCIHSSLQKNIRIKKFSLNIFPLLYLFYILPPPPYMRVPLCSKYKNINVVRGFLCYIEPAELQPWPEGVVELSVFMQKQKIHTVYENSPRNKGKRCALLLNIFTMKKPR